MPNNTEFFPGKPGRSLVVMTIDEYEVIRLLDLEHMTQEQCACQINVARATVTMIYNSARSKIADAIVNGKKLVIQGGNVSLCENSGACISRRCKGEGCVCGSKSC
jgi:predicted DNA-binding protein (UPF0251 family)